MKIELNPQVDKYLIDGCMRCKYGATPQCKVNNWREELETLRQIVLETGLKEEIKWGVPVYTHNGKNVLSVAALKDFATIGFFKGVLLTDSNKILQQQGNLQSDRIVRFTKTSDIEKLDEVLKSDIKGAIAVEEQGKKVEFKKSPEPIPDQVLQSFAQDPARKKAVYALTSRRQRRYLIHFS